MKTKVENLKKNVKSWSVTFKKYMNEKAEDFKKFSKSDKATKLQLTQKNVYECIYLRNFNDKTWQKNSIASIYSSLIFIIPFLSFVPIICAFFNDWNTAPFYLIVFLVSIFYILDYAARLFTIQLYYKKSKYFEALKLQTYSVWSNYQAISAITMIILLFSLGGHFGNGGIVNINQGMYNLIFCIILFGNYMSVVFRIGVLTTNKETISILKKILFSKYKSYIASILAVCLAALIFSFIIYSCEMQYQQGGNEIQIDNMGVAIYHAFIVMTTVGFGDFTAISPAGRAMTIVLALLGICFYAYVGSVFVGIFVEFSGKKKTLRADAKANKEKEQELQHIISSIDNIVIKSLYETGLIPKEKYEEIQAQRTALETMTEYVFNKDDFEFDPKTYKTTFLGRELGVHNIDQYDLANANKRNWFAVRKIPDDMIRKTVLYQLPFKMATEISTAKTGFPILFSTKIIDPSVERIIIYHKKPYKAIRCEASVQAIIQMSKQDAWTNFGKLTHMTKKKYDSLFTKNQVISVLLIKDIISYPVPKLLETYGINADWKLQPVIYLT